jgi:hypothetical protein
MSKTYRRPKRSRDRFDGEAALERAKDEGLSGRNQRGIWKGPDPRGHNQQFYDECVSSNPKFCPCRKCGLNVD